MKKFLLTAVFLMSAYMSMAQPYPSVVEQRKLNSMVIDLLDQYEMALNMYDRQSRNDFNKLFDPDARVFCDIYSSTRFLDDISVKDYSAFYIQDDESVFSSMSFEIRDVVNYGYERKDGKWLAKVRFTKLMNFFDKNLIYYPVVGQKQGDTAFNLIFSVVFNEDITSAKIGGIECLNKDSFNKLADDYYIVSRNDDKNDHKRDLEITLGGKKLDFNEYGQGYAPKGKIEYWDSDVSVGKNVKAETDRYEFVQFKYVSRHLRLRLRNEIAPLSAYGFSGNQSISAKSFAYAAGLDFGYSFSLAKSVKLGIYTGLAFVLSDIKLDSAPFEYSYLLSDSQGRDYTRAYSIESVSQGAKFKDLMVPVYVSFDFRLHKVVSLVVDLGIKNYFNTVADAMPFHLKGNVSGVYADDDSSIPDGSYGIGSIDSDFNSFVNAVAFRRKSVDVALAGYLGFDFNVAPAVAVSVKAGYEMGLKNSYTSSENSFANPSEGVYPLVYSAVYGKDIVVRPLADCVSFKRQALWFDLGLMVKF